MASSATPVDLVDRLLTLGCEPDREPLAVGMVLREPPRGSKDPDVSARRVETLDEFVAGIRIAGEAFEMPDEAVEEILARAESEFAGEGHGGAMYLAWVDGRPVARASAAFTDHGLLLFGGATLPEARGRGAYRALVHARWEDAVARGTPALVTHAGAMSRPILRRLGFDELAEIRILVDRLD